MKTVHRLSIYAGLAIVCCGTLSSCDVYNFTIPLPTDQPDLTAFPKEFLGKWKEDTFHTGIDMDISTQGQAGYFSRKTENNDQWTYQVFPGYIQIIQQEELRILRGPWPRLDSAGNFIYPSDQTRIYNTEQTIKYDTLKNPTDTIENYLILRGKIYEMAEHYHLEKGYPFYYDKDSIIIRKNDTIYLDLGQNVKLKKLSDSLYSLNILKGLLGSDFDGNWWMLLLLEFNAKGQITEWEIAPHAVDLPEMIYDRSSKSNYLYFDAAWTKQDLLRLKKAGYFKPTGTLIPVH